MNLSVKNMIFAFVAGLVVFSLLMTALCMAMFNSEIDVVKDIDILVGNRIVCGIGDFCRCRDPGAVRTVGKDQVCFDLR